MLHHSVTRNAGHAIHVVHLTFNGLLLSSSILLDVRLRVRQMARTRRVATSNRALDEVTLEDVATREGVAAQDTHVGAIAGVSEQMTLQMLGMKIGLGAVRARKLAVRILLGDRVLGGGARSRSGRPARSTREDASAALGTDNVSRLVATLGQHAVLAHHGALNVGGANASLRHSASRHRAENRWSPGAGRRWGRGNWLRMRGSGRGVRHHGGGAGGIALSGIAVVHHGVVSSAASSTLVGRRRVTGHVVGDGSIGSGRRPRTVGIVPVRRLLHSRMAGLERRQGLRREARGVVLLLVLLLDGML